MFYLFFIIRTGGTKPTWKSEQNRSSTLGPQNLTYMHILGDDLPQEFLHNNCMDFVF